MMAPSSSFKLQTSSLEQQPSNFEKTQMKTELGASAQKEEKSGLFPAPQQPKSTNYSQSIKNKYMPPQKPVPKHIDTEALREVVRDEIEKLHDDMEDSLRNLHMDMIKQFHQQSQELQSIVSQQFNAIEQLREENDRLREENEFLKLNQNYQNQPPPHSHRKTPFGHGGNRLFGA